MPSRADVEAGRAFVRLFLKNDMSRQLVRALKAAQAKLRQFGQSAIATGRRVAFVGLAMAAPFAFATRTFAEFDDAMREVKGVTQAVGADFDMLTDKAKKLGASTSFTAIEVALLMAELGRAGFAPKQIDEMTSSVLSLARATKTEGALAAGIMATAIRQFSLGAGDASRVADVLTTVANKSFNTLETLGESLKFVGPVAADFNMSLEDTVAVLGTLGNVGIQASMAGTTMRRILLATGAEAKKLEGIFGVAFVDAAGNARPLVDTLQDIADATRNLGSAERAKKFSDAFGLRGITGASAIGKNITGTRELRDAIAEAGDIAKKTADDMDAGLGGAFRILLSSIEGVKIEIGGALAPVLQKLSKFMTTTAQSAIKWIKANKGMVVAMAATAVGVTVLGVSLMGVGAAALVASFALGGLAAIVSAVLSPVGLITAAVVGATVAFFRWTEAGKFAYRSLSSTLGKVLGRFREVFGGIGDAISSGNFALAFDIMKTAAKLAFAEVAARAKYVFATLIPGLASATFQGLAGGFGAVVAGWRRPLVAFFGLMKALIKAAFNYWVASNQSQFQLAGDLVRVLWDNFSGLAQVAVQDWLAFWINGMITVGKFVRTTLGNAFFDVVEGFVSLAKKAAKLVASMVARALIGRTVGGGDNIFSKARKAQQVQQQAAAGKQRTLGDAAIAGIAGQYADDRSVLAAMAAQTAEAVKSHLGRIAEAGKDAVTTLAPAAQEFESAISGLSEDVRDKFRERFTAAFEGVEDYKDPEAVSSLRERLDSLITEAAEAAKKQQASGVPGAPVAPAIPGVPGASGVSGLSAAAVPRGVALTATYSAAAARIGGYQPGTAGPEEKMVVGIVAIDKKAEKMLAKVDGLTEKADGMIGVVQQFLAGWRVP